MKNIRLFSGLSALCLLFVFASCESQVWGDYYENKEAEVPTQNIMEYLESQSDLSTFCQMLEISGYDTILNKSMSYTVWAPINAALEDVSLDDVQAVTELVQTHIAYFAISTSTLRKEKISVLSGKVVSFVGDEYGTCSLIKKNINVVNGLVHTLNGYVAYMPNLWEYMKRAEGLDSIATFLTSLSKQEFDSYNSVEIGTNADGQPIYDSVFVDANSFLDEVADLQDEDTVFTVLFPNNEAWTKSYRQISKYYNVTEAMGGSKRQAELTKKTLIQDLAFAGRLDMSQFGDSIVSTSGHTLYHPEELFAGAVKAETSNGDIYVTDSIKISPMSSWFDTIRIEAETATYGRTFANAVLYTRMSHGKSIKASNDAYLEVGVSSTASTLSKIYVDFPIPNVLSAKYNIYCVFLPESIDYATARPCKVSAFMTYTGADGKEVTMEELVSKEETSGSDTTKLFLGQMDFSYCNIYDRKESVLSDITTKIRIRNEQRKETTKLSNVMRIDCLILEPVME